MKINFLFFSLFVLCLDFIIPGCKAQPQNQITGQIELHPEWKPVIYLIQPRHLSEIAADYLGQVLDSAFISKDGAFAFKNVTIAQDTSLLELVVQKTNSHYSNHLTDSIPAESNYMPFILKKGSSIKIKANISSFQKSFVFLNPSKENKSITSLRDIRLIAFEKYLTSPHSENDNDSLLIEKEKAYLDYAGELMHFADTTSCIEAAMLSIRWISPTGDFERVPEFISSQCKKWSSLYPKHPYTKQLCTIGEKNRLPVMTGDVMTDYPLPMVDGDTVLLSSLLGKKLTLLDFWASWCAPCRKEIREEVIPLWNSYHDKGFQVIGYSIDANGASWKNAIMKDGSKWKQASHLTGDSSPLMTELRITTIPANYILDVNGKILAKNLHGEELKKFIESQLK